MSCHRHTHGWIPLTTILSYDTKLGINGTELSYSFRSYDCIYGSFEDSIASIMITSVSRKFRRVSSKSLVSVMQNMYDCVVIPMVLTTEGPVKTCSRSVTWTVLRDLNHRPEL